MNSSVEAYGEKAFRMLAGLEGLAAII